MTSSSAPSPPNLSEEWQNIAQERGQNENAESSSLGLTSASVLEDIPRDRNTITIPRVLQDPGMSSRRLEAQAAEQRKFLGLLGPSHILTSTLYLPESFQVGLRHLTTIHEL